ncbi:MAG: S8 family peptidase, partial [Anaerolineae bacterium]
MTGKFVEQVRSFGWGRPLSLLLIVGLLMPAMLMASAPQPAAATQASSRGSARGVQPALLTIAAERPEAAVRVIVQKVVQDDSPSLRPSSGQAMGSGHGVENLVARLGGEVIKDLHIINAFAAEMPAGMVPELARAAGVRWVSLDAPVESTGKGGGGKGGGSSGPAPQNYFLDTLGVRQVWDMGLDGTDIAVAVIDSGISNDTDFKVSEYDNSSRVKQQLSFNPNSTSANDAHGHGTHVAGIIGGNGIDSGGAYAGIAPNVKFISLKISDDTGVAYESDTVEAMQWVLDNKDQDHYKIRVVNLSINSTVEQSYHTSPLDAAAEILWFNGLVVVASAGNKGPGGGHNTVDAAPANDPFIITVGASNEHGTPDPADDTVAPFSAHGVTMDGFVKPDVIAPGKDIISVLAQDSPWSLEHPDRVVLNGEYFRLSGTSMAAPMVTGAVVLLLQDEPDLNPDQVKYRLTHATNDTIGSGSADGGSYPYLNVYAAVTGTMTETANTGIEASQLLWTGDEPINWGSVNWGSVNWGSVNWG